MKVNIYSMSIEKEMKKKYKKKHSTMKIMAYDPHNFPVSNAYQHVWKYGQTVYVTPINNHEEYVNPCYFTSQ